MQSSPPVVRDFPDLAVVIAGGTSGIGLATALRFADAGVRRIALLARNADRGAAAQERVLARCPGGQVEFMPLDAGDPDQVVRVLDDVRGAFGRIDVMVTSVAAAYLPELLVNIPLSDVAPTLLAQALPPLLLTRAVLPIMAEQHGGSIVNVASDAAKIATPGETVLGAAMAAIVMFSRATAIEAKRNGIRVNAVTPSLVANTDASSRALAEGFSRKLFEKAASIAHLGIAEPEDLADVIVFLGGPASARLTGQAISVNGGISAA